MKTQKAKMNKRSRTATVPNRPVRPGHLRALLRRLLAVGGVVFLLVMGFFLIESAMESPVNRVVVNGEFKHLDESVVSVKIQPYLDRALPNTDLEAIRTALEGLPWVKQVDLQRRWPDTLEISIVERRPIARWRDTSLIDYDGAVFVPASFPEDITFPQLSGADGDDSEVFENYRRFIEITQPHGFGLIELAKDFRGNWLAVLDSGTQLVLGREDIIKKMHKFLDSRTQLQSGTDMHMARVDLRYGNGVAITWQPRNERQLALHAGAQTLNELEEGHSTDGRHTGT